MSRRLTTALSSVLVLVLGAVWGCQAAPDEAEWERLAELDEAETIAESLERNTGALEFEPLCEDCVITTEHVATLGAPTDPAGFGPLPEVAADSAAQRFYVATPTLPGQIMVYGADGAFVGVLGRPGEGPGELGGELMLEVGPGDSLHVAQTNPPRYSVWTPEGEFARSVPLGHRFRDFALLPTGNPVLNVASEAGFQPDLLSPAGEVLRRLEDGTAEGDPPTRFRRFGTAQDWLWATSMDRYQVNAWDAEGNLRYHREADPEWEPSADFNPGLRPEDGGLIPGYAMGITSTDDTRVYLLTALPPQGARFGATQGYPYTRTLVQYLYYGLNRVYAATVLDGSLVPIGRRLVYRLHEGANGERRIEVMRLRTRF